jgi:hypothetical protein
LERKESELEEAYLDSDEESQILILLKKIE